MLWRKVFEGKVELLRDVKNEVVKELLIEASDSRASAIGEFYGFLIAVVLCLVSMFIISVKLYERFKTKVVNDFSVISSNKILIEKKNEELSQALKHQKSNSELLTSIMTVESINELAQDSVRTEAPVIEKSEFIDFSDKKVLIVDDDFRNIFALKQVLEVANINVISATNGADALAILQESKVDLVFMDIMMPVLNGFDTIKKIRKELNLVDLKIVALTAKAMSSDREECYAVGANDYLSKPLDIEIVLGRLPKWFA